MTTSLKDLDIFEKFLDFGNPLICFEILPDSGDTDRVGVRLLVLLRPDLHLNRSDLAASSLPFKRRRLRPVDGAADSDLRSTARGPAAKWALSRALEVCQRIFLVILKDSPKVQLSAGTMPIVQLATRKRHIVGWNPHTKTYSCVYAVELIKNLLQHYAFLFSLHQFLYICNIV